MKALLARAMPSILPKMTIDQALIRHRPFLAPHHAISHAGLVGSGEIRVHHLAEALRTIETYRTRICIWRCKMPIVHVNVWEGFGQKNAKTVIQGVTRVFVDMGIPQQAVEVVIHEIPKSHWGVAGEPASERLKDESPPA